MCYAKYGPPVIYKVIRYGKDNDTMLHRICKKIPCLSTEFAQYLTHSLLYTAAAYGVISLSAAQIGFPYKLFVANKSMTTWKLPSMKFKSNNEFLEYAHMESQKYEVFANLKLEKITKV